MTSDERARIRRYVERLDRQRATLADELADEVAQVQGLTMAERGEWIASVCRAASAVLAARPDAREIVLRPEPPAPDYDAIWRRLAGQRFGIREAALDRAYVRRWLVDCVGTDAERVRKWDEIRAALPVPA